MSEAPAAQERLADLAAELYPGIVEAEELLRTSATAPSAEERVAASARLIQLDRERILRERARTGGAAALRDADVYEESDAKARDLSAPADFVLLRAATVKPRKPEWLWRGRIAFGVLTNVEGDPGLGKSTALGDLAARLSSGRPMPGEDLAASPADVVILSAEDDPETVLRPRLEAAGAELERIHFLTAVRDAKGKLMPVSIPRDVERIESAMRSVGARLLIVDPPSAHLGREVDHFKDAAVRLALAPLQEMAARRSAAVIFNRHFNKGGGTRAIYKGGGSIAFAAAARTVLQVYADPEDDDRRVLVVAKCNLARKAPSLMFRVESWERDPDVSHIAWEGETERTADEMLEAQGRPSKSPAVDFLKAALAGGPARAADLFERAEAEGIGADALKRAKRSLGVRASKEPGRLDGPWSWELPL
jgi:hypothetical protein